MLVVNLGITGITISYIYHIWITYPLASPQRFPGINLEGTPVPSAASAAVGADGEQADQACQWYRESWLGF